ncbi:DUF2147 domain-containing protein [uncultured Sulfitobacter sp.]|uniref:DUF2147 domain-containing protein n=1 Tax=uncultured Sulfitobacter sp. TaxID=191468 RepID=UPI002609D1C7|nr:DUF2147 domain-containing protein [uncultured Sulfitobacter sp.]
MRMILAAAVAAFGLVGAASADPAAGTWKTEVDDSRYAHVKMQSCGAAMCGTIVKTFLNGENYKSPNLGKKLVIDMKPEGGGKYAGKVWRPANDKVYIGKMTVSGNSLTLSGCVAGGLICKKQKWSRLN